MATFTVDLWDSIFTPGPTPSLLKATNMTFACLQLLLGFLLVFSFSIHFVVLSALSGSLWWGINWFVRELVEFQQRQNAIEIRTKDAQHFRSDGDDSGTEVEGSRPGTVRVRKRTAIPPMGQEATVTTTVDVNQKLLGIGDMEAEPVQVGTHSSASTEDEWERVSGIEDKGSEREVHGS